MKSIFKGSDCSTLIKFPFLWKHPGSGSIYIRRKDGADIVAYDNGTGHEIGNTLSRSHTIETNEYAWGSRLRHGEQVSLWND